MMINGKLKTESEAFHSSHLIDADKENMIKSIVSALTIPDKHTVTTEEFKLEQEDKIAN